MNCKQQRKYEVIQSPWNIIDISNNPQSAENKPTENSTDAQKIYHLSLNFPTTFIQLSLFMYLRILLNKLDNWQFFSANFRISNYKYQIHWYSMKNNSLKRKFSVFFPLSMNRFLHFFVFRKLMKRDFIQNHFSMMKMKIMNTMGKSLFFLYVFNFRYTTLIFFLFPKRWEKIKFN